MPRLTLKTIALCALLGPAVAHADPMQQMVDDYHRLNAPHPQARETDTSVRIERVMADIRALEKMERWTPEGRDQAARYIFESLKTLGWETSVHDYPTGRNVVAHVQGRDPDAAPLLLGAHLDAAQSSPGADDNASGVAALLEIARVAAETSTRTRRSVMLVFFDQEEAMFAGSMAFAGLWTGERTLYAAVILEGVGVTCATSGCQKFPSKLPTPQPEIGDYLTVMVDKEHEHLLEPFRRTRQADLPLYILSVPDKGRSFADTRRSDHVPFWEAGIGAVVLTDTAALRNSHYHTASDTTDTLDPVFMEKSTKAVFDAAMLLANAP